MRKNLIILTVLFFVLSVGYVFADEVTLTNGDHLTGVVQKVEDGKLLLKTDYADVVTIDWTKVASLHTSQPLVLQRKGAAALQAGQIARQDQKLTVTTASGETEIGSGDFLAARSADVEKTYEQSLHPSWGQDWQGTGAAGLALTRGNSATTSLNFAANADRKTLNDETSLTFTSVYAKDNILHETTASQTNGGFRYDHNVSASIFVYGSGFFETDDLEMLDLRSILGGGMGWHVINQKTQSLNLLVGAAYTREAFDTGLDRNFSAGTISETYNLTLGKSVQLFQDLTFDGYLNSVGNYRTAFDLGFSTRVAKFLTWQTKITDQYVTNPLPGTLSNDLLITTGLGITFSTTPK